MLCTVERARSKVQKLPLCDLLLEMGVMEERGKLLARIKKHPSSVLEKLLGGRLGLPAGWFCDPEPVMTKSARSPSGLDEDPALAFSQALSPTPLLGRG
jgi:hypothetical protein